MAKESKLVRKFPAAPPDAAGLDDWLKQIYQYVENEAEGAVNWYSDHARWKKRGSYTTRYLAILFGGVAGVLPVLAQVWPAGFLGLPDWSMSSNQISLLPSLMLGLVAVALAVDRFGDFSAGWIRYMLTAFEIRAALQEFRLEWACRYSHFPPPIKLEDVCKALELAKLFVLKVEKFIGDETRQWATEFQQNLAGMEKDIAARQEVKKKELEAQAEASRPGAVQLTVTNAASTENRTFSVRLRSSEGSRETSETVTGAQTWAKSGLLPGMYELKVQAQITGRKAEESKVIQVNPNQVTECAITLPE
jgi:hypothetical protein